MVSSKNAIEAFCKHFNMLCKNSAWYKKALIRGIENYDDVVEAINYIRRRYNDGIVHADMRISPYDVHELTQRFLDSIKR